jgi:hypothetical protein
VAAAEALLERVIADSHEVTEGGEFLPLGVWGVRGFNIEAIRDLTPPEDRKMDKVLGEVYRVRVLQTRRTQTTIQKRTHRLNVPLAPLAPPPQQQPLAIDDTATMAAATAAAAAAAAAAALAIEDGLPDEQPNSSSSSSSSSSGSSSSSSSRHKKHKTSKKGTKKSKKRAKKSKKTKKVKKVKKDQNESRQARTHIDVASLSFM